MMFVIRQFILICLAVCSWQLPAAFALLDNQQNKTSSNQVIFEPFKLLYNNIKPIVQEVKTNSPPASNSVSITMKEYVYTDIDCKNPSHIWTQQQLTGNNESTQITFDVSESGITGEIRISTELDLSSSFDVNIVINSGQLVIYFEINENDMKCSDLNIPPTTQMSMSGRICVQSTDFTKMDDEIKSCFIMGGAVSLKTDVQNIHKIVVAGGAIDMGCYQANKTTLSYLGPNSDTNIIQKTADSIVNPIHKVACGSSGIVPSLLITFTVALVGFLRASY